MSQLPDSYKDVFISVIKETLREWLQTKGSTLIQKTIQDELQDQDFDKDRGSTSSSSSHPQVVPVLPTTLPYEPMYHSMDTVSISPMPPPPSILAHRMMSQDSSLISRSTSPFTHPPSPVAMSPSSTSFFASSSSSLTPLSSSSVSSQNLVLLRDVAVVCCLNPLMNNLLSGFSSKLHFQTFFIKEVSLVLMLKKISKNKPRIIFISCDCFQEKQLVGYFLKEVAKYWEEEIPCCLLSYKERTFDLKECQDWMDVGVHGYSTLHDVFPESVRLFLMHVDSSFHKKTRSFFLSPKDRDKQNKTLLPAIQSPPFQLLPASERKLQRTLTDGTTLF